MKRPLLSALQIGAALLMLTIAPPATVGLSAAADSPLLVRPFLLAAQIGELAGLNVKVPYARVVGVFSPRVFLIDTATRIPPLPGNRARVLVFVDEGQLRVPPAMVVASTVTVSGVARTLLGMQVSREVGWPPELTPEQVSRLEIKAAILAASVTTADGVELTGEAIRR
jgi:hypothetical protein